MSIQTKKLELEHNENRFSETGSSLLHHFQFMLELAAQFTIY